MKELHYKVTFTTPAFLGNAEQNAQWRTPPFKALLRQWWRVAYAANRQFKVDLATMRQAEGLLFGHAWLENDHDQRGAKVAARKSLVRLRLDMPDSKTGMAWGSGSQTGVAPLPTGIETGYAWFGLVRRGAGLPDRNAIAAKGDESSRVIRIAVPDDKASSVEAAVGLIARFGQLGSRSRGGWGTFVVSDAPALSPRDLQHYSQSLADCLRHDWATSLCADSSGLCLWQSRDPYPSWDKAMRAVAAGRRDARLALKGLNGRDLRPVLGFASPGRMPSPLRWRVIPASASALKIEAFAMPTRIPEEGMQRIDLDQTHRAWEKVIEVMDSSRVFSSRETRS